MSDDTPTTRTEREIDDLERALNKRGFRREPRPVICDACEQFALFTYEIKHTKLGGRAIKWCHHCQLERSYRRPGGGDLVQDAHFDLEEFVA